MQVNSDAVESTTDGYDFKLADAVCAEAEFVTGGGFVVLAPRSQIEVVESLPTQPVLGYPPDGPPNTWRVGATAPPGIGPWTIGAFALCATSTDQSAPLP